MMAKEPNWRLAPASGPCNPTVRDDWPKEVMLDNTYKVLPVRKVQ